MHLSQQVPCYIPSPSCLYMFLLLPLLFPLKKKSIFIQKLLAINIFLKSFTNPSCHLLDTAYDSHRYVYFFSTCSVPALTSYWHSSDNIPPVLSIDTLHTQTVILWYSLSHIQEARRQVESYHDLSWIVLLSALVTATATEILPKGGDPRDVMLQKSLYTFLTRTNEWLTFLCRHAGVFPGRQESLLIAQN